jgi:hypothetical protein
MPLGVGDLYNVLFIRSTPGSYHWGLYYHWSPNQGTKFHVMNPSQIPGQWLMVVGNASGALKSCLACWAYQNCPHPNHVSEHPPQLHCCGTYDGPFPLCHVQLSHSDD